MSRLDEFIEEQHFSEQLRRDEDERFQRMRKDELDKMWEQIE